MLPRSPEARQPEHDAISSVPMNREEVFLGTEGAGALPLSYTMHGPEDGPPVLVLHGITASKRYWLPRLMPLAERYRLLLPDLPGFGASPKPVADYNLEFFTAAIQGLLERVAWQDRPIRIVAHSLGTLIAMELAARSPIRVENLVLLSVPRFRDRDHAHQIMIQGSSSYRSLLTVNSVGQSYRQMRRVGVRLTARSLRRMPLRVMVDARKFTFRSLSSTLEHCLMHYRVDPTLEALPKDLPICMIHGDADQVADYPTLREAVAKDPRIVFHVIHGAGHHPLHTHTSLCLRQIQEALDSAEART